MKKYAPVLLFVFVALIAWSCENSTAEPDKKAPANLAYSPNSYNVTAGQAGNSGVPTVEGTSPFTFELVGNSNSAISINANTGQVSSAASLAAGSYSLSVKVSNAGGSATFSNALTVNVAAANTPPSGLAYSPVTIRKHEAITTNAPSVQGTAPFSFSITNSDALPAGISINASTGAVTIPKGLAHNDYSVNVKVSNAFGESTAALSVKSVPVVFTGSVGMLALVQSKCGPCHVSGAQPRWTDYNTAKGKIDTIISRVESGSMPQGGPALSADQIALIKQWKEDGLKEN